MHVGMNRKLKLLMGVLSLGTLAAVVVPAQAQITIVIGSAPPPVRYEQRPPPPRDGYVWQDGFWGVNQGKYVWVPGRWDRAPFQGAYWVAPRYTQSSDGWHMQQGHWNRGNQGVRVNNEERGNHHDNGNHYGQYRDKDKHGEGNGKDKHKDKHGDGGDKD